jgi:superfamily II DNA/RNA helicase
LKITKENLKENEMFDELKVNPSLITALRKENITIPTEVQTKVIPLALENKDLIVRSETGTGKTLAYLLPLFQKINTAAREMQALILVPTHELAIQVQRQIERLSENSDFKVTSTPIIGNVKIDRQIDKLKEKPHIIVGSAGRILELIKKKKISAHTLKTIIMDEADRLMDENNEDNIKAVIKTTLKERQIMMFSATMSEKTIEKAKGITKEPEIVVGEAKAAVPAAIEHIYLLAEQREKIEVLRKLVRSINPGKAVVFINRSEDIEVTAGKLRYHGLIAEGIHGSNTKLDRKRIMDAFRAGKIQLLIASDIAARGLDIEDVTHIFNLDMPEDPKDYLHRVGRTGRKGKSGSAISITTERELPLIKQYERNFNIKITPKGIYMGKIVDVNIRQKNKEGNKPEPQKVERVMRIKK